MRRKERVGASQVPCLRLLSLLAVSMQPREERIRRSALAEQPLSLRVIMVLPGPFAAFFCVPTLLPPHFRALSTAHKAWSQLEGGLWTVRVTSLQDQKAEKQREEKNFTFGSPQKKGK